jgi:hypothetical protein
MPPRSPIPAPSFRRNLPLYARERSFPAYRFVPGLYPHPTRDPKGHSYQSGRPQEHPSWSPDQWNTLETYLRGVDLFNRFYFWEAHEVWEALWTSLPANNDAARFLQGIIHITASFLKIHMNEISASQKLWDSALALLEPFKENTWMGIEVNRLLKEVEVYLLPIKRGSVPTIGGNTPSIQLVIKI